MRGRTASGVLTTSWPNTSICPEVGMRSVEAIRRNVVFPAPFRPRRAIRSLRRSARDTPRNASTSGEPRPRYTFRTSTARSASVDTSRSKRRLRIKLDSVQFDPSKPGCPPLSNIANAAFDGVLVLQPQTHEHLVLVRAADEHVAAAGALALEAEGLVQAARPIPPT